MVRMEELLAEVSCLRAENAVLKERLAKYTRGSLERLKTYRATHPDVNASERAKKSKAAHREEYNARRREARRLARCDGDTTGVDAPPA